METRETHGAFSWMEWQGEDTASARDFYHQVVGWPKLDMPMQDGSTYPAVTVGDEPVGGFAGKPGLANQWLPYITVDDVDARSRKALEAGGELVVEPFDAPGVGRISILRDPAGAAVAFIAYPATA